MNQQRLVSGSASSEHKSLRAPKFLTEKQFWFFSCLKGSQLRNIIWGKSLAKEEQEEVKANGLKRLLQWETDPHRLVTKYASILHAVRETEIGWWTGTREELPKFLTSGNTHWQCIKMDSKVITMLPNVTHTGSCRKPEAAHITSRNILIPYHKTCS